MPRWVRPYQQRFRPFLNAYLVVFSALMWLVLLGGIAMPGARWQGIVVIVLFGAVCQVLVCLFAMIGVFVGEPGIRLRTLFRTTVIPWHDVHRVRVVEDPYYRNRGIVVVTRYGTRIPTPAWQFVWWRRRGPMSQNPLTAAQLDALAATLDDMAAVRNGRSPLDRPAQPYGASP